MIMPPTAPPAPPKPTTEATSCFGNISEASVKRLADQPCCAEVETEIKASAHQLFGAKTAAMPEGMQRAQTSMAVLRPAFTDQPWPMRKPESHPPSTLPRSAARKGIQAK